MENQNEMILNWVSSKECVANRAGLYKPRDKSPDRTLFHMMVSKTVIILYKRYLGLILVYYLVRVVVDFNVDFNNLG